MLARLLVPREDYRQAHIAAKAWLRIRGHDHLSDVHKVGNGPPVCAAGDEHHVGTQAADAFDLLPVLPPVVHRDNVHDDGPGAKSGTLRALRAHRLHDPGHRHLQSAAGTGR